MKHDKNDLPGNEKDVSAAGEYNDHYRRAPASLSGLGTPRSGVMAR